MDNKGITTLQTNRNWETTAKRASLVTRTTRVTKNTTTTIIREIMETTTLKATIIPRTTRPAKFTREIKGTTIPKMSVAFKTATFI